MSVLVSVAHSSKAQGAVDSQGVLTEYHVSLRASEACWRSLSGEHAVELYDCGPLGASDYDDAKVLRVNACKPDLAVEIHCNAGTANARYGEVIHASAVGFDAAQYICNALSQGFAAGRHGDWPTHGPRLDDRGLFFLQRTIVPAVIVEGLFITNDEQARWLASGGAETYGVLVAEGIKRWLRARK